MPPPYSIYSDSTNVCVSRVAPPNRKEGRKEGERHKRLSFHSAVQSMFYTLATKISISYGWRNSSKSEAWNGKFQKRFHSSCFHNRIFRVHHNQPQPSLSTKCFHESHSWPGFGHNLILQLKTLSSKTFILSIHLGQVSLVSSNPPRFSATSLLQIPNCLPQMWHF